VSNNLIKIWKAKGQILKGIKNNIFKKEHVEEIAEERLAKCLMCEHYSEDNSDCIIAGISPCCNICGCSIKIKIRSLSSDCPEKFWPVELTQEEDDAINEKLGLDE